MRRPNIKPAKRTKTSAKNTDTIMAAGWKLSRIRLSDMPLFCDYIRRCNYPANDFLSNFPYLWAISQMRTRSTFYRIMDEMLVVFYKRGNELHLQCLPFGAGSADKVVRVITRALEFCKKNNGSKIGAKIREINEMQLDFLRQSKKFEERFSLQKNLGVERHVDVDQLIELRGNKFANVRHSVNQFHRLFPDAVIRRAGPDDYDALLQLKENWNQTAGTKYSRIHDEEAYRLIVRNYQSLDHLILVVENYGQIIGMISGGVLPTGEAWACFSKKMTHAKGLSDVLLVELAKEIRQICPETKLMNLGRDAGVKEGLRRFKDKFNPVLNLTRYRVYLK